MFDSLGGSRLMWLMRVKRMQPSLKFLLDCKDRKRRSGRNGIQLLYVCGEQFENKIGAASKAFVNQCANLSLWCCVLCFFFELRRNFLASVSAFLVFKMSLHSCKIVFYKTLIGLGIQSFGFENKEGCAFSFIVLLRLSLLGCLQVLHPFDGCL